MKQRVLNLITKFTDDDVLTLAAALALYTSFSLAPLLVLMLTTLTGLNLDLRYELQMYIGQLMGQDAVTVLRAIIEWSDQRSELSANASLLGILTLLFSASAIFAHLQKSMNVIFLGRSLEPSTTKWWQDVVQVILKRAVAVVVVLGFIVVAIVSILISSVLSNSVLQELQGIGKFLNTFFDLGVFSLLFAAIFKWIPDRKIETRAALLGGLITAALFTIGKILIGLYLGKTAVGSAYGAAGSIIVVLAWVYYSSLILFCGAEIADSITRKA